MEKRKNTQNKKNALCEISFEGWDWKNILTVRSTITGNVKTIRCNGKWNQFSPELNIILKKIQVEKWNKEIIMALSFDVMNEIKQLAN